jgi:hypothetical protein
MTTPDQLADDIDNAVAHSVEVDGSLDVSIDKALAAMRSAADALAAGASALHTARNAHNAQANVIRDDLGDTANMVRDLQVADTWTARFPGDTAPGTLRWGQGGGNDSARAREHEAAAGVPMGYWRLFYTMSQIDAAVAKCKEAIAAGRVPKLSMKPGMPWTDVAVGKLDVALRNLFGKLGPLDGPVHFILHHEPEGGGSAGNQPDDPGGAPAWRAMQRQVRAVLDGTGATNIAFGPCLMAYTWSKNSGRNPDDWWVDGIFDFYSADLYQSTEAGPAPVNNDSWLNFVAWCERRNIPMALGELGNRGNDAVAGAELRETYEFLTQIDCVGSTYFDTSLNSGPAPYTLTGAPLAVFRELMADPRSVTLP